jgi:hypothetical protein
MAKGNLKVRVTGEYKGDHVIIKDALNTTLEVLNEILKQEALRCLQEMAKGNLDVAVTGQYQGDFAIIKEAINTTINDLNEILSQVSVAIDQVNTGARQVSDSSQASQVQGMLSKFKLKRHGENFAQGGPSAGIYPYVSQRRVQHLEDRNHMQKEVEKGIAKVAATSSAGANVKPEDIISLDDTDYGKF